MAQTHHIFLIPGFFGFANMGELLYFSHVKTYLPEACRKLGLEPEIHLVHTYPTASIRRRAERLLETMHEVLGARPGPAHLVGHSTGGLDARLVLTPGVTLRADLEVEPLVRRVRTLVTVSTPHYGTPLANFFTSLFGQKLLRLLSLGTIYVLRYGRLPSSVLLKLGAVLARVDNYVGLKNNVLDQLYGQLLADFSPERRQAVELFFTDVGADQSLLPQLTPEGIDVFNAATSDRPGVRYGCAVSYARPPGLLSTWRVGLDPYGQATHALFYGFYRLTAGMPQDHLPQLSEPQVEALLDTYGMIPDRATNDGIVPTLSQVWGEIIHATMGDHHDVLGHFGGPDCEPPHIDWLTTGSDFERVHFEALWTDVARYLAGRKPLVARPATARMQHLQHLFHRRGG